MRMNSWYARYSGHINTLISKNLQNATVWKITGDHRPGAGGSGPDLLAVRRPDGMVRPSAGRYTDTQRTLLPLFPHHLHVIVEHRFELSAVAPGQALSVEVNSPTGRLSAVWKRFVIFPA